MGKKAAEVAVQRGQAQGSVTPMHDWDPLRALRHQMERLVAGFEWPDFRFGLPHRTSAPLWPEVAWTVPAVDLVERNGGYELHAELPGLSADQIEVRLSDGMMIIMGEKTAEKVEDDADFHLHERSYGAFQRVFRLPAGVEGDKVKASFENGILKVTLPKTAAVLKSERKVEVKAA